MNEVNRQVFSFINNWISSVVEPKGKIERWTNSKFNLCIAAQYGYNEHKTTSIIWCTKGNEEQQKCENLVLALERDRTFLDDAFLNMTCINGYSADACIHYIDSEKAHITTLDAGDVFTAGRYSSLVPIMQEKFEGGFTNYYSVAVIKKDTLLDVMDIRHLRNKKACFPWVGSLAGWIIPIYTVSYFDCLKS